MHLFVQIQAVMDFQETTILLCFDLPPAKIRAEPRVPPAKTKKYTRKDTIYVSFRVHIARFHLHFSLRTLTNPSL